MPNVINVEILQVFEDRLGKEGGHKVAEVLERAYIEKKKQKYLLYKKNRIKRRANQGTRK